MLQAIITALLSGLFSGGVLFALNERRDRLAERLRRIEEAYLAVAEWCDNLGALMTLVITLQGKPFSAVMDDILANQKASWSIRNKALLLTRLWLVDELQVITLVEAARISLSNTATDLMNVAAQRFLTAAEVDRAQSELQKFVEARNVALAKILAEGRAIAHRPPAIRLPRWRPSAR